MSDGKSERRREPPLPATAAALASQNHLMDSLTSHISLYASASPSPSPSCSAPRSSILKWLASLGPHQRRAHLTVFDPEFVRVLIRMLGHLRTRGHGSFILLPDLPEDGLPGLCYKKSRGLLSRVAESGGPERSVFDSVRLFSSKEGEGAEGCSVSVDCLDSVTVSEGFVENVESFVETMDKVSNGGFLRGEESELGADWVELSWLKAKGYYALEAFVANRLEVALRLAWLNCHSGKKRGVKLKEKLAMANVAANVFWRKKGCVDWWSNLDAETLEILTEVKSSSKDRLWAFSLEPHPSLKYNENVSLQRVAPELASDVEFGSMVMHNSISQGNSSFANVFNRLLVLQDAITLKSCLESDFDSGKVFFSSLNTIGTISDCILAKLRGLLVIIYLECTKLELLGEESCNLLPNKSKEKHGASGHKKKGRPGNLKRLNSAGTPQKDHHLTDKSCKAHNLSSANTLKSASKMPVVLQGNECQLERSSSIVEMESAKGIVAGKIQTSARRNKKAKRKNRNSILEISKEHINNERSSIGASSISGTSQDKASELLKGTDNSTTFDCANLNFSRRYIPGSDSCSCSSTCGPCGEEGQAFKRDKEDSSLGSTVDLGFGSLECSETLTAAVENPVSSSVSKTLNGKLSCKNIPLNCFPKETDLVPINGESAMQKSDGITQADEKSAVSNKQSTVCGLKEDSVREWRKGDSNQPVHITSLEWHSHEWPNVASTYIPSANSHLPTATDRLHLDAGHNWHNHFRQPFLSVVHQTRNPPIESGCKQMLTRSVPMSSDWPPVVRNACGIAPSLTCGYDSGFISRRHSTFHQGFTTNSGQHNSMASNNEKKYSADFVDIPDLSNTQELIDECDSHWISEEEFEVHGVSGLDYNQYFGGGVMYWNPSDHPGTGFSRPPSLSSDDSFWTWQEAEMNRTVDDMVAFSSSYSTNGLASPTAASFCSPFDPLVTGHQALGYVVSGNDVPGPALQISSPITDKKAEDDASGSSARLLGDLEGKTGDPLPYPGLRPIIIPNMSRERPLKRSHDLKSPRVPPTRREQPRIKRPPSPVVLCVPRAPRPPPPSPVGESRKHRGFPTVRSGSSSPRHWGMRGWYNDIGNLEESSLHIDGTEVVMPSWRNNNISAHPVIQPLPGRLLPDRLIAISHLACDQEHPDVAFSLEPPEAESGPSRTASLSLMHSLLHDEIDSFCKQVAAENLYRKPYINWAIKRVTRSLQVLWPRSRANIFGSNATGLSLPSSDVDLVVCLPPVRNLEPIKEAGILEGRNGIKETCLQHAARYLANQDWVKSDSLKTVENTAIPIIKLVVEVPQDLVSSSASSVQSPKEEPSHNGHELSNLAHAHSDVQEDSAPQVCSQTNYNNTDSSKSVCLDISFKSASHTGLQTTELVKELTEQFPAASPLALVLKQFLADRSLDQSYSGGLSSYCLVLLITRFLQHERHLGRSINQNFGSLLMDFLYFFGNVFDPREMRVSVRGSGLYLKRERGYSIDPIHIDDPLFPTNNIGRNCFRIHQCIKAFAEAYSALKQELTWIQNNGDACSRPPYRLLPKIIPSIDPS
ncbi:hypothetical protein BT93_G1006 [Corymbia citriodora subsp. variegata]|nr:hypothetical protein BT93_G1006 [Corymbia citriodora subsp. variegata]KAF8020462.1 hypothetical protein BT93_G1006 [Corymbia citriodora subsp. variegata]